MASSLSPSVSPSISLSASASPSVSPSVSKSPSKSPSVSPSVSVSPSPSPGDFIPHEPTLADMAAGDTINYQGQSYAILSVGAYVDDGGGLGHRTVTISPGTFTVHTSDTICSSYGISDVGVRTAVWSQTSVG